MTKNPNPEGKDSKGRHGEQVVVLKQLSDTSIKAPGTV